MLGSRDVGAGEDDGVVRALHRGKIATLAAGEEHHGEQGRDGEPTPW